MGWLIALAIIVGVLLVPVGIRAIYRQNEPGVWILVGCFPVKVYPVKKKQSRSDNSATNKKPIDSFKGGKYRDFFPIARAVYEFLEELRTKLRVQRMELLVTLAGDDPADLAINYGRAWAALGSVTPQLERLFSIKRRKFEVSCDFEAEETLIYARIDATVTLARALHLLSKHGIKIIKQILDLKKLRKGGI